MRLATYISMCTALFGYTSKAQITCRYGAFPLWMEKFGTNALIDHLRAFDMNWEGEIVSIGTVSDPASPTTNMSFVRLTESTLDRDRWFRLFVQSPSTNTVSVPNSDGLEAVTVKF